MGIILRGVELEARAPIAAAVDLRGAGLTLGGKPGRHVGQVFGNGGRGLPEGLDEVGCIALLLGPDKGDGCALVARPPCTGVGCELGLVSGPLLVRAWTVSLPQHTLWIAGCVLNDV